MKILYKVSRENRVRKDDLPRAVCDAHSKGRVLKGKNCMSLIVLLSVVFGKISTQKIFFHYPNIFEVFMLG